jgi:hypothetical protein
LRGSIQYDEARRAIDLNLRIAVMVRSLMKCAVFVVGFAALFMAAEAAHAVGYWNVPGSSCQWWGVGFGAGYHAKFVLGPISIHECCAHNEVRLPYALQPPYGNCGCYGCGNTYVSPTMLEPTVHSEHVLPAAEGTEPASQPAFEPEPVELGPEAPAASETSLDSPTNVPRSALFGPPVER